MKPLSGQFQKVKSIKRRCFYIAHVEKYHKGALGHLCKHYQRAKDENGEYIKFKNQSIDLNKTAGNYNLAVFQSLPQIEFIHKRLSEVKVFNRSDVKVMCDWVVTLPKIMGKNEERFFEETCKFLTARYGKENVISAYVHRDETQPHLHFAFIPVTTDKKKGIQKVSAKEVLSRVELQKFHSDLDGYMTRIFGCNIGILNGATVEGNRSIDELKRGTAVKKLKEATEKREIAEKRIDELACPQKIEPVREKKDIVVITKEDFEKMNNGFAKIQMSEKLRFDADAETAAVYREQQKKYWHLYKMYDKLKIEHTVLENKNHEMSNRLHRYDKVFKAHPSFLKSLLQLELQIQREESEAERAAQALKRKLKQLEKGEWQM